jgi:chromosome segregation ATPase
MSNNNQNNGSARKDKQVFDFNSRLESKVNELQETGEISKILADGAFQQIGPLKQVVENLYDKIVETDEKIDELSTRLSKSTDQLDLILDNIKTNNVLLADVVQRIGSHEQTLNDHEQVLHKEEKVLKDQSNTQQKWIKLTGIITTVIVVVAQTVWSLLF